MKIKRTVTETLDIPDDLSIEEAAQLLQNPGPAVIDEDDLEDDEGEDDDEDDEA